MNLESFSEKYKRNQMEVTKGIAQAIQFINDMGTSSATTPVVDREDGTDTRVIDRSQRHDEEKIEQKNGKIRAFKRKWKILKVSAFYENFYFFYFWPLFGAIRPIVRR